MLVPLGAYGGQSDPPTSLGRVGPLRLGQPGSALSLLTSARPTFFRPNRIQGALQQAGADLEHVVRTRIYVTDISRWQEVGQAHGEMFGSIRPATSMIEVSRLIEPALLVEIEVDAIVP